MWNPLSLLFFKCKNCFYGLLWYFCNSMAYISLLIETPSLKKIQKNNTTQAAFSTKCSAFCFLGLAISWHLQVSMKNHLIWSMSVSNAQWLNNMLSNYIMKHPNDSPFSFMCLLSRLCFSYWFVTGLVWSTGTLNSQQQQHEKQMSFNPRLSSAILL